MLHVVLPVLLGRGTGQASGRTLPCGFSSRTPPTCSRWQNMWRVDVPHWTTSPVRDVRSPGSWGLGYWWQWKRHSIYFKRSRKGLRASASSVRKIQEKGCSIGEKSLIYLHIISLYRIWGREVTQSRNPSNPLGPPSSDFHFPKSVKGRGKCSRDSLRITENFTGDVTFISGKRGRMWCFLTDQHS